MVDKHTIKVIQKEMAVNVAVIDPAKLYTPNDVRKLIPGINGNDKVSLKSVHRWIIGGKLAAKKVNRRWMVTGATILKFLSVRERAAKPLEFETREQMQQRGLAAKIVLEARWAERSGNGKSKRQPS